MCFCFCVFEMLIIAFVQIFDNSGVKSFILCIVLIRVLLQKIKTNEKKDIV